MRYGKCGVRHMGEMGGWAKNKYLRGNASHDMRSSCAAHMHSCRQRLAGSPTNALEESRSPSFSATSRQTCVGDSRLLWWAIGVRWRSLAVRLRSGQSFGECGLLEGGLRCLSVSCCYSRVWAALLEHASNRSCACVCVSLCVCPLRLSPASPQKETQRCGRLRQA